MDLRDGESRKGGWNLQHPVQREALTPVRPAILLGTLWLSRGVGGWEWTCMGAEGQTIFRGRGVKEEARSYERLPQGGTLKRSLKE